MLDLKKSIGLLSYRGFQLLGVHEEKKCRLGREIVGRISRDTEKNGARNKNGFSWFEKARRTKRRHCLSKDTEINCCKVFA